MNKTTESLVIKLWPDAEPDAQSHGPQEVEFQNRVVDNLRFLRNVTVPTLTAFLPDPAINTGTAVIVCPGGGLHVLAIDYEGLGVAQWLCERGIAAFVLKYRLIQTPTDNDEFDAYFSTALKDRQRMRDLTRQHKPIALADGQQALSIVRQRADEWGIKSDHIGMIGFSAGAFVTIVTTLQADRYNRPDFVGSIYGAMWETLEISSTLPPLFIALTDDDALAVKPSLQLYSIWHEAKCPVELHIYARGEHGFAMRKKNPAVEGWINRFYEWLQVMELVKPGQAS